MNETFSPCQMDFIIEELASGQLIPHIHQRVIIETPKSILDLCKFPYVDGLQAGADITTSTDNLTIDRIEFDCYSGSSAYKKHYRCVYHSDIKDILDIIDTLPHYDVILVSGLLERLEKTAGYQLIDKLLQHADKKLILTTEKSSKNLSASRWSYIDFHKYDFSCTTVSTKYNEIFMHSFYPGGKTVNPLDTMYKNFKASITDTPDCLARSEDTKKLNIAYILPHRSITGGLKVLIKQMKLLKAKGHTITGILQGDYSGSIFPDTYKIEIDKELLIPWNDKIDNYLEGYDVIVTGFINDWVRIEEGKFPIILFEQGYETIFGQYKVDPQTEKNHKLYFDSVYNSRNSLIVSVSSIISDIFYYRYGRLTDTLPNGVDITEFSPKYKSDDTVSRILLIGSPYLDFKGFDLAIKVLKRLEQLSYTLDITWICQSGPSFPIPLNINYVVNPEEKLLAKVIRENDILLSTSWYESFALPPLEAMASGTAVVATDSGGIRTYAKDGYNCILVGPGDTDRLLEALLRLILDKNERDMLISNGLKTASEFRIDNMINLWEDTLYRISDFYKEYFNES